MTRDEFMRELAYLLQDIQEQDKEDAIQYYMDYFDEAGPEQESQVIRELGSPERISSIIRSDIAGHLEKGGEFTESGYQDERFRDPNYQVARRFDLPEKQEQEGRGSKRGHRRNWRDGRERSWQGGQEKGWEDNQGPDGQNHHDTWQEEKQADGHNPDSPRTSTLLKVILWIILIIVAAPILLGIGGGTLGVIGGILGIFIAILILTGVLTAAMLMCGVALFPFGIVLIFTQSLDGFLLIGISLILLGIGGLLLALSALFYGRFIPFLIRSIVDSLNHLLHKGRRNL